MPTAARGWRRAAKARVLARRHAAYFVDLAERAEPELRGAESADLAGPAGPRARQSARRAGVEREDRRCRRGAVGRRAVALLVDAALRQRRAPLAGERSSPTPPCRRRAARTGACMAPASSHGRQGDIARAQALVEECLALRRALSEPGGIASALNNLGNVAVLQRDFTRATLLFRGEPCPAASAGRPAGYRGCAREPGDGGALAGGLRAGTGLMRRA